MRIILKNGHSWLTVDNILVSLLHYPMYETGTTSSILLPGKRFKGTNHLITAA